MDENIKLIIRKKNDKINHSIDFISEENENIFKYNTPKLISFNDIFINIKQKLMYIILYILVILIILYMVFY